MTRFAAPPIVRRPLALLALGPLSLMGCAGEPRGYPTLAPRAIERQGFAEPARPVAAATPDAALDADLARRAAELDRLAAGFDAATAAAQRDVDRAAGQPAGSEAWLAAQVALTRLDDWRGKAGALAGTVETLASDRAGKLQSAYPGLDALAARAGAEADRESQATARLQALLPSG